MRLAALVNGNAEVIGCEATLTAAAERMVGQETDALAVVSGRLLVGVFTEHDLAESVAGGADPAETVQRWMTESPDVFPPETTVTDAVAWLLETGYRHLPVMEGPDLLGIVGIRDLVWALAQDA